VPSRGMTRWPVPFRCGIIADGGPFYWKLGLPLLLWFFVVSVFLVPLVWRF
jgi:hypothetical protein